MYIYFKCTLLNNQHFCIYLNILSGFYICPNAHLLGGGYYTKEMMHDMMENILGYLCMILPSMYANKKLGSDSLQTLMFYMVSHRKSLIPAENIKSALFDAFLIPRCFKSASKRQI